MKYKEFVLFQHVGGKIKGIEVLAWGIKLYNNAARSNIANRLKNKLLVYTDNFIVHVGRAKNIFHLICIRRYNVQDVLCIR